MSESVVSDAPKEATFNIDAILQSTTRFTRKAWNVILELRGNLDTLKEATIRCTLEAKSAAAAEVLQQELSILGVKQMSRNAHIISMTTNFETLQKIIKRSEVACVDLIKL